MAWLSEIKVKSSSWKRKQQPRLVSSWLILTQPRTFKSSGLRSHVSVRSQQLMLLTLVLIFLFKSEMRGTYASNFFHYFRNLALGPA